MWFAIHIGAYVEQDGDSIDGGRKNCGQRWPIYTRNGAEHHLRGDHGGAGIACGDETSGTTFTNHSQAHSQRRIPFGAHCLNRLVLHGDDFGGRHDVQRQSGCGRIAGKLSPGGFLTAD